MNRTIRIGISISLLLGYPLSNLFKSDGFHFPSLPHTTTPIGGCKYPLSNHHLKDEELQLVKKIHGFYGMVGPNVTVHKVKTLYDLLLGDGMVQGVFFNRGELVFVREPVRTNKLIQEREKMNEPYSFYHYFMNYVLYKLKMAKNCIGLANTSLLKFKKHVLALYELDTPYQLCIDQDKKIIQTDGHIEIPNVEQISGHSKVIEDHIETIDYNIFDRMVHYYQLNDDFKVYHKTSISMIYMPMVHDFVMTEDSIVLLDSPFEFHLGNFLSGMVPLKLNHGLHSVFHLLHKDSGVVDSFECDEGFYIFHYSHMKETEETIELYACMYDELDFTDFHIQGKYRKVVMDKKKKTILIEKKEEFESMNLDFPLHYHDYVVMRNVVEGVANEFVVCKDHSIVKKIKMDPDKCACVEPVIRLIDGIPYLIVLAVSTSASTSASTSDLSESKFGGHLIIINLENSHQIQIPIQTDITIGFHSLFLEPTSPSS